MSSKPFKKWLCINGFVTEISLDAIVGFYAAPMFFF
tara:strand:+ start:26865 stop:26972 length:108 start_codon:yes stop_codon:yes gene_type:complete